MPESRPGAPPAVAEARAIPDRPNPKGDNTPTDEEFNALLNGLTDEQARAALDAIPALVQIIGSPALRLAEALLEAYSKSPVVREAARRALGEVRSGLEGPDPSPLERLLAERAAICWLTVNTAHQLGRLVTGQVVQHQQHPQRRQLVQQRRPDGQALLPAFPGRSRRTG